MKIPEVLHLATYESFGGAARATKRIFEALKAQPIRCHMFTLVKTSGDKSIHLVQPKDPQAQLNYIHALLKSNQIQKLSQKTILESYGEISAGIVDEINSHQADIIHLHWINNLLSIEDIGRINKPIVWTLHDMWPFSGSEHYHHDPNAFFYESSTNVMAIDHESLRTFALKQEYWGRQKFKFVAPSHWLAACARRSILINKQDIKVVAHPIDYDFWSPQKSQTIKEFQFDFRKKQILFIGQNIVNNPTKGWDLLQGALLRLAEISDIEFELVIVGHTVEFDSNYPFTVHSLGEILSDEILVNLYSAVDLLVVPSRSEAFSQVTLEAQSCGLPVVGFDIGGIPDILIHKKTGWISAAFDVPDFSEGINWILKEEGRAKKLGLKGRQNVMEKFSLEKISRQYRDLYQQLLSDATIESRTDYRDKY